MDKIFSDKTVTAKKEYRCDACAQWDRAGYMLNDCETHEQRLKVASAEADGWKILPGQKYRKVTGINDGVFMTYRARLDMDDVCYDLNMWDE